MRWDPAFGVDIASGAWQEDLVAGVNRALQQLKASCSFDDFVQGARTLVTFVGNVVKDPSSAKCGAFIPLGRRGKSGSGRFSASFREDHGICPLGRRTGCISLPFFIHSR